MVKNPPANPGDTREEGSIPGSGRPPGERHGNPLQYSCLENSMDRGAWQSTVQGVAKSWTRLSHGVHTHIYDWGGGGRGHLVEKRPYFPQTQRTSLKMDSAWFLLSDLEKKKKTCCVWRHSVTFPFKAFCVVSTSYCSVSSGRGTGSTSGFTEICRLVNRKPEVPDTARWPLITARPGRFL